MFRCLGRLLFLVIVLVLAPVVYFLLTPVDEYWRATALMKIGQQRRAIELLKPTIERFPNHSSTLVARYDLGDCYLAVRDYDEAIDAYRQALQHHPASPRAPQAQMSIARCLMSLGRDENSITAFAELRRSYPQQHELVSEAEFIIAQYYFDKQDWPASAKHARWIVANTPDSKWAPRAQLLVGDILRSKEAYDRSIEAYQKVVDLYPNTTYAAQAEYEIGKIQQSQKKDLKSALAAYKGALVHAKNSQGLMVADLIRQISASLKNLTDLLAAQEKNP